MVEWIPVQCDTMGREIERTVNGEERGGEEEEMVMVVREKKRERGEARGEKDRQTGATVFETKGPRRDHYQLPITEYLWSLRLVVEEDSTIFTTIYH